jgi:hypothetical protein
MASWRLQQAGRLCIGDRRSTVQSLQMMTAARVRSEPDVDENAVMAAVAEALSPRVCYAALRPLRHFLGVLRVPGGAVAR